MDIHYLTLEYGFNYLKEDENGRSINIYKLNDCLIDGVNLNYPNCLIYSDQLEKLFLPVNEQTMSLNSKTIYHNNGLKYNFDISLRKHYYDQPVFFFIYNVENYFHFIYDSLPNLISYYYIKKKYPTIKLLINYPTNKTFFYKFVLETFDIFNIKLDDLIIVDKNTEYSQIFITDSYTHNGISNIAPRKEIFSFYQEMVQNVLIKKVNIETYDKIYISRRTWIHQDYSNIGTNYTTRRKLINEDLLVEKLVEYGFKEIFTENLSMIEKIFIFNKAKMAIGPIGGGIVNVIFSNPKTTNLIALVSPTFLSINTRFTFSLNTVNVHYFDDTYHIESDKYKTYMRVISHDSKIVGEIEEIKDDNLLISYSDSGSNVGWSLDNEYKKKLIKKEDVKPLDNGLNSPWRIDVYKLLDLLSSKYFIFPM